ncbi:MAG TPA: sugar phosphate isomerase/epimerase family protein [Verrucomicrobiae bacterium]|nr:sugar phosphate isomerase/epimerase family protein [Verrucomicrobiae bacterium]
MFIPGLVSVTFRRLAPADIVALVNKAGLKAIEWGGDVHVPYGNILRAREVRKLTQDAGLSVAAYGSYYRLGSSEQEGLSFQSVLETAVALETPVIRVWAGTKSSAGADDGDWRMIIDQSRLIAELARSAGVTVAYEYHDGTLTDTWLSTQRLLQEVNHPNVRTLWQPSVANIVDEEVEALRQLLGHVANIHVFHWRAGTQARLPLADGGMNWRRYFDVLSSSGRDHHTLIEFVRGDEPAAFMEDAQALRQWLETA